jgi:hypothetical protein
MLEPYVPRKPVYRRNAHRFVIAALFCVGAGLFAMFAWLVHPLFVLGCIPWLVLAYRMLRIGVFVSNDGVVVRNVLHSRRVRWSDVERFDWGTGWSLSQNGGVWSFPVGCVYLRSGGFVRALALNPPFELDRGHSGAVPLALAGLNDELARARAAGLTGARVPEPPVGRTGPGPQLTLDA